MDFEITEYGNMLVYKKGYTSDFVNITIKENNLSGLRIFDHLDRLDSLSFLREYKFLEKLHIDCIDDKDFSFLEDLTNLKDLGIGGSVTIKNPIDLSTLVNLKSLSLHWRKNKIKGIEKCINVSRLALIYFKESDLSAINSLKNIKKLMIKVSPLKNLDGFTSFDSVEEITIANCRNLNDIKVLNSCTNLTSAYFDGCPNLEDFEPLSKCSKLKDLTLFDCKRVKSIKFVKDIELDILIMGGSTDIVDGDLIPAKKIKDVRYDHRPHYNIKIVNEEHEARRKANLQMVKDILGKI
jgi:hypothetical protein